SKDLGLKEPYNSQLPLTTSEVAEDLTYYFAKSEQVPSAVALGVLMEKDNTVKQAGGFIIQLMPFADEKIIEALEEKIAKITSVTSLLEKGLTPEQILEEVLEGFDIEFLDTIPTKFDCNCSKKKVTKALIGVGRKGLKEMIDDGEPIEVNCHFCNTHYVFEIDELKALLK
ncbi:MAG: Hsp33 family molecular chaperone HslO, partial [Lachnospiraceae bacterium]|nr:Hsp33 family molecular chaperone HslO [Lachnospiraceae bacterium]